MPNRELPIPDGARQAPEDAAFEIMRVWWVNGQPEFVLKAAMQNPENIGRLLAEAAHHFSQVHAAWGDGQADDLLKQIRSGWDKAAAAPMLTRMTNPPNPGGKG